MLDIATIEQPTIQQRGRGDFEYVHDSIADLSLYEQKAVFEKIPLEALRPTGPGLDILQPEPFPDTVLYITGQPIKFAICGQ